MSAAGDRSAERAGERVREQPLLAGSGFVLRPWRAADAPDVFAVCQDPEIDHWIPIPRPYTLAVAEGFIAGAQAEWEQGSAAAFAIVEAADDRSSSSGPSGPSEGRLLGAITRHGPFGAAAHRASFGYWLAPWARGCGIATAALQVLVEWTFATSPVIRCDLYTIVGNDRSAAVALRAGFTREGVLRAWEVDRGMPVDCVFYSRLRGE